MTKANLTQQGHFARKPIGANKSAAYRAPIDKASGVTWLFPGRRYPFIRLIRLGWMPFYPEAASAATDPSGEFYNARARTLIYEKLTNCGQFILRLRWLRRESQSDFIPWWLREMAQTRRSGEISRERRGSRHRRALTRTFAGTSSITAAGRRSADRPDLQAKYDRHHRQPVLSNSAACAIARRMLCGADRLCRYRG